ncbi:hypothetical protein [Sporomusa aerivorans]|uniref:hypothetical protein n=1 Tax=Sporomusa aerivorans TaxID=204936 RepID=UPI003529FC55
MLSRIHSQTDVLKNGKIMMLVDGDPGCYILTDLKYTEHALKEVLVCTYKTIQEITAAKNNFSLDAYVNMLVSLTNNLKIITESLLALKTKSSKPDMQCSTSSEALAKIKQSAWEDKRKVLNQIEKICDVYGLKMINDSDHMSKIFLPIKHEWYCEYPELEKIMDEYVAYRFCELVFPDSTASK